MVGFAELLLSRPLPSRERSYALAIFEGSRRMADLIDEGLEFVALAGGRPIRA
jgi:hypothetical protein